MVVSSRFIYGIDVELIYDALLYYALINVESKVSIFKIDGTFSKSGDSIMFESTLNGDKELTLIEDVSHDRSVISNYERIVSGDIFYKSHFLVSDDDTRIIFDFYDTEEEMDLVDVSIACKNAFIYSFFCAYNINCSTKLEKYVDDFLDYLDDEDLDD
jgi:hypothetical protein